LLKWTKASGCGRAKLGRGHGNSETKKKKNCSEYTRVVRKQKIIKGHGSCAKAKILGESNNGGEARMLRGNSDCQRAKMVIAQQANAGGGSH